jgi:hypothetical protein
MGFLRFYLSPDSREFGIKKNRSSAPTVPLPRMKERIIIYHFHT